MGKKKKRLKQLTAGIVIGAITISTIIGTMFAANSIKPEEATTSVAVFEDLLNNRSFVIDTFTKDAMPDSNPYGKLDGVGNIDYLSKDFLDNYKNDSKFGSAVDLYYRMNHEGETFSEIPSALLDVFANEADWTKFCQGAKSKSYDSLLTSIYQNDYKSVSGKSVGNEENSMQTLRTYSEKLGVVKDADEFIKEYFGDLYSDVNEIDEYNYLRQKTKLFDDNLETYVTNVNKVLIDGALKSDNTKTAKDFSSLYEAKYYADYGREGAPSIWNERYVAMNVEKNTKYLKKVTSAVKNIVGTGISTVNNIIMMENLYRNQESMHDTLVRVRNNAKKNNDNTFIRASSTYLKMLESDDLGDNVILNSGLKAIYDYSTTELNKFIWDKTKEGIRDEAASIVATQTGMDTLASQMAVSSTVGRTNAILAVGEALTKYGTGFDDVCEKIYLMKYLQEIKEYAVEAFNTDKDNYQKYKNESNMKEMDNYASAAIDDLQFLKRIVLLQNQLGYKTADAQMGSIAGKIMSWIDGCDDANDLEARYTNLQNALVDTAINPISTNPFSIDEGCTLKVIHSTDSELQTYAVYTNKEGKKCTIAEFDKVLLAGIKINGGTLNISDQADRDIVMNSLFVTDKGGSLQITGNGGDIHVGRLDINGEFYKPEKCTKKLIVEGNCNVISSCSLENLDLDIEGNTEITQGNLHMKNDSDKLLVKGNLILGEDYGTNSEHEMTAGTVEVKGDFTSKYKRDNSSYGYYETEEHKTIFSGDKTQKISFVQACNVNGFNENLELVNNDINFATSIYDVKINQDTELTNTKELVVIGTLDSGDYKFTTTGNVEAERFNTRGKEVDIEGNVKAGILYITGNNNQTHGNLKTTDRVIFDEGNLSVDGDMEMEKGHLYMTKDSDKLLVKGNLILGEGYGTNSEHEMTAGTVEVKGDFTSKYKRDNSPYGYYETANHKTVFSGDKTQKISFVESSEVNQFNGNLELKNPEINFATPIYSLTVNNDMNITKTDNLEIKTILNLEKGSLVTNGNVHAKTMNIESRKNNIKGNLQVEGNVSFGEGSLTIDGNTEITQGNLHMKNDSDNLLVKGNLILGEDYGTNSEYEMTEGTVEVKGDFTSKYKRDYRSYGYYETLNHKTIFSGDKTQKISFTQACNVNGFNENLELENNDINFATPIYDVKINQDTELTNTKELVVTGTLDSGDYKFTTTGNVEAERFNTRGKEVDIEGNVKAGILYIAGDNNQIHGNLKTTDSVIFSEGSLSIAGDTEIEKGHLYMTNDSDKLLVKGNLILGEDYGTNSEHEMTAGTVEVKGDFTSKYKRDYRPYGYYETGNHATIFSGGKTQKISFAEPSEVNQFNGNLELKNSDINFATPIYSLSLNQDTTLIHTDTLNVTDTLKLNGNNLLTTGKVNYGRLNENGGTLEENPKLGHNYYKQLQPADPKEYDAKYADEIWVCKSCGKIFTDAEGTKEYDPDPCKNGHTIVVDEGKKATCITEGLTEGEHCKVCKKIIVAQKKIPATGHKYYEWTTTKENTCTEEGITQRKCRICSFTESKKLDKKAHEWDTDFTVDKKATFQADGSKSKHCKNCDAVYGSIVIPRVNEMKLSAVTYSYTGGVKTPSVTVKDAKGKTLKNNVDYTIKYASGRKNVGTYSVIMTLKGNYSTSKTMKFIINPKGTSISKLSKAKKSFTVKWKKQNTQTTGYRLIYSMNSKFKTGNKYVMITSNKTTSKSIKKLKAKKKYYIRICTYKTVGGTKYYSGWSSVKSVTTK